MFSGFVKLRACNLESGVETLLTCKISKGSAKQRAGRAGRVLAGKCFRLYPESEYASLLPTHIPEIQRINLAPAILQLKSLGVQNLLKFSYLSVCLKRLQKSSPIKIDKRLQRPPSQLVIQGLHLLYALGAIDGDGLLTSSLGTQMSQMPLPPMHAKALMTSGTCDKQKKMQRAYFFFHFSKI